MKIEFLKSLEDIKICDSVLIEVASLDISMNALIYLLSCEKILDTDDLDVCERIIIETNNIYYVITSYPRSSAISCLLTTNEFNFPIEIIVDDFMNLFKLPKSIKYIPLPHDRDVMIREINKNSSF